MRSDSVTTVQFTIETGEDWVDPDGDVWTVDRFDESWVVLTTTKTIKENARNMIMKGWQKWNPPPSV